MVIASDVVVYGNFARRLGNVRKIGEWHRLQSERISKTISVAFLRQGLPTSPLGDLALHPQTHDSSNRYSNENLSFQFFTWIVARREGTSDRQCHHQWPLVSGNWSFYLVSTLLGIRRSYKCLVGATLKP